MGTTQPTIKIGATLLIAALGMMLLVHLHPEKLKAPAWLAFFALGILGFAGICIIAQALRPTGLVRWLVCALVGGMAVVPTWIALGQGPRQCVVITFGARSAVSQVMCRGAFGLGAAILLGMFILAVRAALRGRAVAKRGPAAPSEG